MSILEAYEPNGQPIITPDKFYPKLEKRSDVFVVCFSGRALEYVLKTYEHELFFEARITANGLGQIYYLPYFKVYFMMSLIGAAVAGGLLQELAFITGATQFVYFGSCGVLDPSYRGKFLVPTECYREEGYSYHYAPPSDYIAMKNHAKVEHFLGSRGVSVVEGKGWTTDAIYNETLVKYEKRKEEGVICVDMEASALQAIADHIGVDLYIFFFSGDILGETWRKGELGGTAELKRQISSASLALDLGKALVEGERLGIIE